MNNDDYFAINHTLRIILKMQRENGEEFAKPFKFHLIEKAKIHFLFLRYLL